jgi:cytochrome c-type biogenesis protein CcmE
MSARPRLVIALAVASLLSVFLVYQVVHGSGMLLVSVAQLQSDTSNAQKRTVQLTGTAVRCTDGPCSTSQAPFNFTLKDDGSAQTVQVRYPGGAVPDAFKEGRHVIVTGKLENGMFVAQSDSLITKCPSKYSGGGSASAAGS